jgi:hypothetical protein
METTKHKLGDATDEIVAREQPSTPAKRPKKGEQETKEPSETPDLLREDSRKKDDSRGGGGGQREAGRKKSEEQEENTVDVPKKNEHTGEDKTGDAPVTGGDTLMGFGMYAGMKYEEVMKNHYDYVQWSRGRKEPMELLTRFLKWSDTPEGRKYELIARGREVFPIGQHKGESFEDVANSDFDYHVRYWAKQPFCKEAFLLRYTSWFREKFGGDPHGPTRHFMYYYDSDSSS